MTKLTPKSKQKIIIAATIVLVLAVIVGACAIYLNDYYRADIESIQTFLPQGSAWKEAAKKLVKLGYTNIVEFGGILDYTGEVVTGQ